VAIWLQLLLALALVPTLALMHGWGLMGMSHMFNLTDDALLHKTFSPRSVVLVAFVASLLFTLHALEIALVGMLYLAGHAAPDVEHAVVVSASYYTTTGASPETLPDGWRIIGQAEALLGLLLIGWSTAFLVRKIDRLAERHAQSMEDARHSRLRGRGYGGARREDAGPVD
jgi:hypothetical protein